MSAEIMKTTDGGSVWTVIDTFYACNGDVVADPNCDTTFWSGGCHDIGSNTVMAVSKTFDIGETWTRYDLTSSSGQTSALVVDPMNSNVVYAGGYEETNAKLFKTIDGGDNWSDISAGLGGSTVRAIAINPKNTDIVYAGTPTGVFKSLNGGSSWNNTGLSLVRDILVDPNAGNTVYVGTGNGFFMSRNSGSDWYDLNDGIDTTEVYCLGIVPDVYLYCGTFGYGAYRLVPNFDPPEATYITQVEKSSSDVTLTWNAVTTDTAGRPEEVVHYVVYRSTSPSFVPETSDSIAAVAHPETSYTDIDVLSGTQSYYYLVRAVDNAGNKGAKSNMSYVFHKTVHENRAATDKNWGAIPYNAVYRTISDAMTEYAPQGNPLNK